MNQPVGFNLIPKDTQFPICSTRIPLFPPNTASLGGATAPFAPPVGPLLKDNRRRASWAIGRVRQAVYGTKYWTYDRLICRRTNYLSHFTSLFPLVFVFTSYLSCLFVFRDRSEPQISPTPSWKGEGENYPISLGFSRDL